MNDEQRTELERQLKTAIMLEGDLMAGVYRCKNEVSYLTRTLSYFGPAISEFEVLSYLATIGA